MFTRFIYDLKYLFIVWIPLILISTLMLWTGPSVALNPPQEDEIEQGARLYAENCAVCHGPEGKGRIGATLAKDWPSIRPDLRVKSVIENGVPGTRMPAWSQQNGGPLSEQEIDALVAFILSWQTGGFIQFYPPPTAIPRPPLTPIPDVQGDPNRGAVLYDQNCALCHGPNGEGRVGATLAKNFPSIRPDLRIRSTIERGIEGSVMPAWAQEFGGPLTQSEINDLVAFLLTWSTPPYPLSITETSTPIYTPIKVLQSQHGVVLVFIFVVIVVFITVFILLRRNTSK